MMLRSASASWPPRLALSSNTTLSTIPPPAPWQEAGPRASPNCLSRCARTCRVGTCCVMSRAGAPFGRALRPLASSSSLPLQRTHMFTHTHTHTHMHTQHTPHARTHTHTHTHACTHAKQPALPPVLSRPRAHVRATRTRSVGDVVGEGTHTHTHTCTRIHTGADGRKRGRDGAGTDKGRQNRSLGGSSSRCVW